jgi:putative transposase
MPRRARKESPTRLYHVTSRGNGGVSIYLDDADRAGFLAFLASIATGENWSVFAYCLLGTHFHLVLRAELEHLSRGMQRLKGRYGQYFNGRYARWGHLFEARFPSRPILDERHAVAACSYVAVNPVAAGMCATAAQWQWSSHRAHVGLEPCPTFLQSLESFGTFDGGAKAAVDVYRAIVAEKERELRWTRASTTGTDPLRGSVPTLTPPTSALPRLRRPRGSPV